SIFSEQNMVLLRTGAAVKVLVGNGDQTFVEQRVALARHLHPAAGLLVVFALLPVVSVSEDSDLPAAGGCVNPHDLMIAAQFLDGNRQCHQVNVESALRVLAWRTQLKQVKDGLDVGIETIVTLSSECKVAL